MKRYRKKYLNKKRRQKHMLFVMCEYFILVIIVCILYLAYTAFEAKKNESLYNNNNTEIISKNNFSTDTEINEFKQQLLNLKDVNKDIIGWISIDNTNISYPLLQTVDNSYYLTHNYKNETSNYGSIFMHKNSVLTNEFSNLIIYGHNMNDNSQMFSSLLNYRDKDFYDNHKTIRITTEDREYVYTVFAVFKSRVYENSDTTSFKYYSYVDLYSKDTFNEYISNCKKYQLYNTGVSAVYGNQLITLSTCEYSQDNGRLVVVGKKIKSVILN